MKITNLDRWVKRLTSTALVAAVLLTYSMVTLAASGKPVGELTVSGSNAAENSVTVNGEPANSGRTLFSSSTITTPDGMFATLNLGTAGKLQLAPNSTFNLSGDAASLSGSLTSGSVTVLSSSKGVNVTTLSGSVTLNAGETATATSTAASKKAAGTGPGGLSWWVFGAIVAAGVVATIIIVKAVNNDDNASPIR